MADFAVFPSVPWPTAERDERHWRLESLPMSRWASVRLATDVRSGIRHETRPLKLSTYKSIGLRRRDIKKGRPDRSEPPSVDLTLPFRFYVSSRTRT